MTSTILVYGMCDTHVRMRAALRIKHPEERDLREICKVPF